LIRFYHLDPDWLVDQNPEWVSFLAHHMGRIGIEERLELIHDLNAANNPKTGQRHIQALQARLEHTYMPLPSKREVRSGLNELKRIKSRSRYA